MAEREHMIGHAPSVGVVALNREVRAVVQQSVDHMGSLAFRRGDHLGGEWRVAVGHMRIERHGRLGPLVRVDGTGGLGAAIERKVLPV